MHHSSGLMAVVAALSLSLSLSACVIEVGDDGGGDEDVEATAQELSTTNGVNLNGVNLNGVNLNGVNLNGVNLNGVSLNGTAVSGVTVGAAGLTLLKSTGPVSGAGAVGARFTGSLSNGGTLQLKIAAASLLPGNAWGYRVEATTDGTTWANICGGDVLAIAIAGRWDYRSDVAGAGGWIADAGALTFGCRGYAIAKCVEWGYAPWKTVGGVLLRNHHQACVRMVRGDYCGNGHAWTTDGNPINVYDALGLQADSTSWPLDGEWTAAGARCVKKTRVFAQAPTCVSALKAPSSCGGFTNGALIVSEFLTGTTSSTTATTATTSAYGTSDK
jgi:hypothetical protein